MKARALFILGYRTRAVTTDAPLIDRLARSGVSNPKIERFPGGASNDMIPNLQNPKDPLPYDPMNCR